MTTFTLRQLDQETKQAIDTYMTEHCLFMSKKMSAPTWEHHMFFVMSLQHFCDWDTLDEVAGSSQALLGYPEEIYNLHMNYLHFVGENSTHLFFAQKRANAWVILSLNCCDDTVRFRQVTTPCPYTSKLGWDIDIDLKAELERRFDGMEAWEEDSEG